MTTERSASERRHSEPEHGAFNAGYFHPELPRVVRGQNEGEFRRFQ